MTFCCFVWCVKFGHKQSEVLIRCVNGPPRDCQPTYPLTPTSFLPRPTDPPSPPLPPLTSSLSTATTSNLSSTPFLLTRLALSVQLAFPLHLAVQLMGVLDSTHLAVPSTTVSTTTTILCTSYSQHQCRTFLFLLDLRSMLSSMCCCAQSKDGRIGMRAN